MTRLTLLFCAAQLTLLTAFHAVLSRPGAALVARGAAVTMASQAVIDKKSAVVDQIVETMEGASLLFSVRTEGITPNQMNMMRQKFPDEVTIRCVKNTLVRRASEKVPRFQGGDDLLKGSNYWFFVPESQVRTSVELWGDWIKATKKEENAIVGGVYDGQLLDNKGVEAVSKLPTKQELMQMTAVLLKALPTNLARALDEAGAARIARATKQAAGKNLVQAAKQVESKL